MIGAAPQRLVECLFTMEGDSGIISSVLVQVVTAANGRTVYGPRVQLLGLWCFWVSFDRPRSRAQSWRHAASCAGVGGAWRQVMWQGSLGGTGHLLRGRRLEPKGWYVYWLC